MKTSILERIFIMIFSTSALLLGLNACTSDQEDQQQETLEEGEEELGEAVENESYSETPAAIVDPADTMEVGDLDPAMPDESVMNGMGGDIDQGLPDDNSSELGAMANQESADMGVSGEESFEFRIQRGDWLSKIAQRVYGDMYKWPMIANANPQISNPNRIYPNKMIKIPIIDDASRRFSQTYSASNDIQEENREFYTVTVKSGDSLSKIAENIYGASNAWTNVWEANRSDLSNPNMIKVGQVLKVLKMDRHDARSSTLQG